MFQRFILKGEQFSAFVGISDMWFPSFIFCPALASCPSVL